MTLFVVAGFCLAASGEVKPLKIVATTADIGSIVRELAGPEAQVTVLIPPGLCPGDFQLRPSDLKAISGGGILFYHGWEVFADRLLKAAQPARVKACPLDFPVAWLVPATQIKAAERIAAFLSELDGSGTAMYTKNLALFVKKTKALDEEVRGTAWRCGLNRLPVIASVQQKDFLLFLGCEVVATYGRVEELTPGQLAGILEVGRTRSVHLVVDNLQSGTAVGKRIAERLGAAQVIFNNFPGGVAGTDTMERAVWENVGRLCQTVRVEQADGKSN